jgi:hypothetical protein
VTLTLESLAPCFQGLLPSVLYTCSRDGIPNAAYLSHVDYVDSAHVALSFQFFNKSRRNVAENPKAFITVLDPDDGHAWQLRLHYVRSETSGPLFDRMALRIEAIASYCGLKGIFKLLAADIYEVKSIEPIPESGCRGDRAAERTRAASDPVFTMQALQEMSSRIQSADSLESLIDSMLEVLDQSFGFKHAMLLMPGEDERTLVTIASRGYPENGIGAEARVGEGIIGLVAEARKPIRIAGLLRGMLYAWAMHHQTEGALPAERRIPLPGLANPESQLGVPLLVRGELIGVLCLESEEPYRFHEEDKTTIELLAGYLAIAIQNMQLQERAADVIAESGPAQTPVATGGAARPGPSAPRLGEPVPSPPLKGKHEVVYYQADECILVDGEYLIRSLPAKILWKLLTARQAAGRVEFTNRELRLDKSLNLPEWKDNLESRLLLLRRRLEQKCPTIRLTPKARGRFALEVCRDVELSTRP